MTYILWQPIEGAKPEDAAEATGPNFRNQWVRQFGDDLDKAVAEFRIAVASSDGDVALMRW